MLGTITEVEVRVGNKVSVNYNSYEVSVAFKAMVPSGANPEEVAEGLEVFGKAFTARGTKEWMDEQAKPAEAKAIPVAAPAVESAAPLPAQELTRVPIDDDGNEYKDIVVDHIKVIFSEEGEKRARTFGKPWMQYGAITYPETLAAVGFDLEASAGGVHKLPAPYTKARVLLGEKNAKGFDVPKKVVAFLE